MLPKLRLILHHVVTDMFTKGAPEIVESIRVVKFDGDIRGYGPFQLLHLLHKEFISDGDSFCRRRRGGGGGGGGVRVAFATARRWTFIVL